MSRKDKRRYTVTLGGKSQTQQAVIIASNEKDMLKILRKYYNHLITDEKGKETSNISFLESPLA